ncbi:hypothetical protein K491DRAFT_580653, partial [Lophiostoma macrostomum CBS 122681]
YAPFDREPIAVGINTWSSSPGLSKEDAQVQLHVWITSVLLHLRTITVPESPPSITLPLIFVTEEKWELLFAHDWGTRIEVVHSVNMGDTKCMLGCYQILKMLRVIAGWVDGPFR